MHFFLTYRPFLRFHVFRKRTYKVNFLGFHSLEKKKQKRDFTKQISQITHFCNTMQAFFNMTMANAARRILSKKKL